MVRKKTTQVRSKRLNDESQSELECVDSVEDEHDIYGEEDLNNIVENYEENEFQKLPTFIKSSDQTKIKRTILSLANQEDNRLYPFANSIFIISEPRLISDSTRTEIMQFLISELAKNNMTPHPTRILTDYLSSIIGNLPIGFVLDFLVNDIREKISSGKIGRSGAILDLLPSAIDAVMSRRSVTWGKEPKSPSKFITYVIAELLDNDFEWHEDVIAPAMKNFNESRINDALQAKLVTKVFDQMETMEYNKLNHIVKELIKIKTKTTRTTVIKCLVGFFSNPNQFRQSEEIEDAILGVINLFIKQTQVEAEFGKTVLTIFGKLQENSYFDCLQMFTLGVLLTMSEMSRYKQAALKLLKNIVSKSQQLQTLRTNSSWLVSVLGNEKSIKSILISCAEIPSITNTYSNGVIELIFGILDTTKSKTDSNDSSSISSTCISVLTHLAEKGSSQMKEKISLEILSRLTYTNHSALHKIVFDLLVVRKEVILPDKIAEQSSFKIELLHLMKEKLMTPILTCLLHQSKNGESRDQSRITTGRSNKNCISQDEMVKSIRKSSNSSVLSSRILAAKSYLILLEQTKIETASEPSQVPFRNSNLGGCDGNENAACEEFLDGLLRCLTQQLHVKETIYLGLYDVARLNPGITPSLHSLLVDRMNSLITSKGSGGISFENLVSDDQVQENPPLLLALVSHLAERTARSIDAETDFVKKIEKIQYHIQEKVSKAVRSDFKCSQQCEDSKSIGNLTIAINLITACIEAHLLRSSRQGYPEGCVDSIGMLLYSLENLKGFFNEKCGTNYSKVKCRKYVPNIKHCVSFLTLSKMSQEFEKIKPEKETNLSKLNDLQGLQKFLIEHLTIKLNDVIKDGTCLDFIATDHKKLNEFIMEIGACNLKIYAKDKIAQTKSKNTLKNLEIFSLCLKAIHSQANDSVPIFARKCWSKTNSNEIEDDEDPIKMLCDFFEKIMETVLIGANSTKVENGPKRELPHLLATLNILYSQFQANGEDIDSQSESDEIVNRKLKFKEFIVRIAEEGQVDDARMTALIFKQMLTQAITISHSANGAPPIVEILIDICSDLHFSFEHIGDGDVLEPGCDDEIKETTKFKLLTETPNRQLHENKCKETFFVVSAALEKFSEETNLVIKKFGHAIEWHKTCREDKFKGEKELNRVEREKKNLNRLLRDRIFQWSLIITEIVQSCMPNQQCTRHVIDRIIDWLKAIKSYLKLFEPKEYPEPPAATIKGIRKIPNIGHLLNKFIDYLDRMPDEIEPPPPKKSKKGEKEKTSQQKKMSDRARQKLMQRNRRLPDLKMAYTEYFKEMARFASDYNMTETILENMTSLTLRDIEIDMN